MKMTGEDLIKILVKRCNDLDKRCDDSTIINLLRDLDYHQVSQFFYFGDVHDWHNERIDNEKHKRILDVN